MAGLAPNSTRKPARRRTADTTEGIIERLEFRGERSRYERALGEREHHDHLIDLASGAVIEFRSEEIEALQAEIARRLGFRIVSHRLELYAVPLDDDTEPPEP